jgi:integrase
MLFCLIKLKAKSFNTKINHLVSIKLLNSYLNEKYKNENFENFLNENLIEEIDGFCHWMYHKKYNKSNDSVISNQSFDIYIRAISNFLEWYFIRKKISNNRLNEIKNKFKINLVHHPPKIREYKSLSELEVSNIKSIISINSNNNPFKNEYKLRNYLVIELLLQTGLRIGELLLLKIENVIKSDNNYYIQIAKNDNDFEDTRKIKPSIKNNWSYRIVSISHELYNLLDIYFIKYRKKISLKNKVKNGYIFISNSGQPLNLNSLNSIFIVIKTKYEIQFKDKIKLTPHALRHTFVNQLLEYLIDYEKIEMELAKDKLRQICGWSNSSPMPAFYAGYFINKRANEINIQRINNINYEI